MASNVKWNQTKVTWMIATLSVNVRIRLALLNQGVMDLLAVECDRMPWIAKAEDFYSVIRECCEAESSYRINLDQFKRLVAMKFTDLLTRESIEVMPEIELLIEAREAGSLDRFAGEVTAKTHFTKYEDYVRRRSTQCSFDELEFNENPVTLDFDPDPSRQDLSIRGTLQAPVWLNSVSLMLDREKVAENRIERLLESGPFCIEAPSISPRQYSLLNKAKSHALLFNVGDGFEPDAFPVRCETPRFVAGPLSIFMDMGSTRSKLITMAADSWTDEPAAQLKNWIDQLDRRKISIEMRTNIDFKNPIDTRDFLARYTLPEIEKRQLAEMSDQDLARWLGEAVHRFAVFFSNQSDCRAIGEVVWSFPRTKNTNRDFDLISREANAFASRSILGKIHVIEEHQALHYRFRGVLQKLAESSRGIVSQKQKKQDDNARLSQEKAESKIEYEKNLDAYTNTFWPYKLFKSPPPEPDWSSFDPHHVPTVSEFCKRFAKVNAADNLSDWIALDAGGFTLDVYGQIGGKEMGTSYEAGGDEITEHVRACLADEKELSIEQVASDDAEMSKRVACERRKKAGSSPVARACRDKTIQVYGDAIREVVKWAVDTIGENRSGIPLILTGGAMYNDYLRELIETEVKKCNELDCVLVTSIEIGQVIQDDEVAIENGVGLRRFYEATRGFNPKLKFDISRDIAAGLLESVLCEDRR